VSGVAANPVVVDVLIAGGGMVGAALALDLAGRGFKVLVVERGTWPALPEPDSGYDIRVSALNLASEAYLTRLGAWPRLAPRAAVFRRLWAWEQGTAGDDHGVGFAAVDLGRPHLGHIAENRLIQAACWAGFADAGVQWRTHAEVSALVVHGDVPNPAITATLRTVAPRAGATPSESEPARVDVVRARLAVACDGAQSPLRDLAGIAVRAHPYGQAALVAHVRLHGWAPEATWQRFTPDGPQALLPLPAGQASLVWYRPQAEAERLAGLPAPDLLEAIRVAFPVDLPALRELIGVQAFPLVRRHAERYHRQRVVLVGDAAHTINPLVGQGVNMGLADAAALAEVLAEGAARGRDYGSEAWLDRYSARRWLDNSAMITASDLFARSFLGQPPLWTTLRRAGLDLADRAGPIKQRLLAQACGV